ncbi:MAG: transglutaminase domain-containing protein [Acidobacteriota bacterium]
MTSGRNAALLALAFAGAARADRVLVEGDQRASFLLYGVPESVAPRSYQNNGYDQVVLKTGDTYQVEVSVGLAPIGSRTPFPIPAGRLPLDAWDALSGTPDAPADDPDLLRLALRLQNGASTEYEVVTRVIDWVSAAIAYDVDPRSPAGAKETLVKKRASCVGMANLSVGLLRSLGIPARDVHGILAERRATLSGAPVAITSGELHRWIEVYFPDAGWIYSDPLRSCHFVDARHIAIYPHTPGDAYDAEDFRGVRISLTAEDDVSFGVDKNGSLSRKVRVRRNLDGRYAAAVVGTARGRDGRPIARGVAVLEGAGARRQNALDRLGKFSFTGIAPGTYALRVFAEPYTPGEVNVSIASREIKHVDVTLAPGYRR